MTIAYHPLAVSNNAWLQIATSDMDGFIQDHADCERRSSAIALGIIAKYPEKHAINIALINYSIHKLQRFKQLYTLMHARSIALPKEMTFDLYGKQMGWLIKSSKDERLMDRLLIAALIEAREQERLHLVHETIIDGPLKEFYSQFLQNTNVYLELATDFFPTEQMATRWAELCEKEVEIFQNLELRSALH